MLGLLLIVQTAYVSAQSGRNKQNSRRNGNTSGATRSKRVTQTNSTRPRTTPTPVPTPETHAPLLVTLPQDPPPFPTPTPVASASAASTSAGEEIDEGDVVRINSTLVTVPTTVVDDRGRAVAQLKLEDFELRVDGQEKQISDLHFSDSPVRIALLFDNSMSLSAGREFEKHAAVRFFRRVMRPTDQAAIFSIYTFPILAQPLTNDVQTLVRTIESFAKPEDGTTSLFDTVAEAAAYLRPYQGRKVIVIVSDGADTTSNLDFDTTLQRVQAADCQIYSVQTGQSEGNANLYDLAAQRRLQTFSEQTGGALYVPKGTNDIDAAFTQIATDLAQQYILSYYPSGDPRDGLFRTISVRVRSRPNLRVRARRGYYAPKITDNQRR